MGEGVFNLPHKWSIIASIIARRPISPLFAPSHSAQPCQLFSDRQDLGILDDIFQYFGAAGRAVRIVSTVSLLPWVSVDGTAESNTSLWRTAIEIAHHIAGR